MEKLKKMLTKFNKKDLKKYLVFSILFMITIVALGTYRFTEARYETNTRVRVTPTLAFFVVGVESETGQIKLESMIPRTNAYLYKFEVSNFSENKKANVDLRYSIEIITTTNMPLEFKIFKGEDSEIDEVDSDTFTTDENGVHYRHLVINDVSTMSYQSLVTDSYILWVEFPLRFKDSPNYYAGIIDLVDIKINAEQVV